MDFVKIFNVNMPYPLLHSWDKLIIIRKLFSKITLCLNIAKIKQVVSDSRSLVQYNLPKWAELSFILPAPGLFP